MIRLIRTVAELLPGEIVTLEGSSVSATFVAQTAHPIWPQLQLVVWRLSDGGWSHDALHSRQQVGTVVPCSPEQQAAQLRAALLGGP